MKAPTAAFILGITHLFSSNHLVKNHSPLLVQASTWQTIPITSKTAGTTSASRLGTAVATANNVVVVTAPSEKSVQWQGSLGAVYVYRESLVLGFTEVQRLQVQNTFNISLGTAVSVSGNTLVAAALRVDNPLAVQGRAHVFVRQGPGFEFVEQAVLADTINGKAGDNFGTCVATYGDRTIVVGSPLDDDGVEDAGKVFSYTITADSGASWGAAALQQVTAPNRAPGDRFGQALALQGDTLVVGAYGVSSYRGAAYVFTRSGVGSPWTYQARLVAPDAAPQDYFGFSVTLDGPYVVVGAYQDDDLGAESGSVYIFNNQVPGNYQGKLTASDGSAGDNFGYSVALQGGVLVVGAWKDSDETFEAGSAYVFRLNPSSGTFAQAAKLAPATGKSTASMNYGTSVAVNCHMVVIGAPLQDTANRGADTGAVLLYGPPGYLRSTLPRKICQQAV